MQLLLKFLYIFRKKRLLFVFFAGCFGSCWWTVFREILIFFFSFKLLKAGNFRQWFKKRRKKIQCSLRSKMYGTLKHTLNTIKWLFTFWIWQINWKQDEGECLSEKKVLMSHVVSPNCAGKFILCISQYLACSSNFVRLALHTSQIKSVKMSYKT